MYVYMVYNIIIIIVRRERQRRYVHGRPSAHKRTGGRKQYDFIGRVGQLSLRQFDADAAVYIIIIIVCALYIPTIHSQRSTHAERHRESDRRRYGLVYIISTYTASRL